MFQPSAPTARSGHGTSRALGLLLAIGVVLVAALSGPSNVVLHTSAMKRSGTTVRVSTFNVLGAIHTEHSRRFDPYDARMRRAIRLIDDYGFSIVGLQEFEIPQYNLWQARQGDSWGVFPGMELGRRPVQNSIVWRNDTWTAVEKHSYEIPYFHGRMVPEPYVLLRNKNTGDEVWVVDTHNPANSHGPAERFRDRAEETQIDLVNQLSTTGHPVLLLGDFNETSDAFCNITGHTSLVSANPGSWDNGTCHPPRSIRIDWIFLSDTLQASNYTALFTDRVHRITDHHIVYADITIP